MERVVQHYGLSRFEVKRSDVVKKGSSDLGLHLRLDAYPIYPNEKMSIGVYGGMLSTGLGEYHYDLEALGITIDGTPSSTNPLSIFGRMNQDIHNNKVNVHVKKDGRLIVVRTIMPGDELLIDY
jgi:hypothetical protein